MAMQSFTRNYDDNSTDAGFEFTFYCDICGDGFKSRFIESKTYKKGGFLKGIAGGLSTGAYMLGMSNLAYGMDRGADILGSKFEGMSPEWHREHENAFMLAMNEAKNYFHRCHGCHMWVCDACYNDDEGMCTECTPMENTVVAKAKAERFDEEVREKAAKTSVFKGKVESRQIVCPTCGKPAGKGKFCSNCGASIALPKCPHCGACVQAGTKFCSECGANLNISKCPECGAENKPNAKFCCDCGTKLG